MYAYVCVCVCLRRMLFFLSLTAPLLYYILSLSLTNRISDTFTLPCPLSLSYHSSPYHPLFFPRLSYLANTPLHVSGTPVILLCICWVCLCRRQWWNSWETDSYLMRMEVTSVKHLHSVGVGLPWPLMWRGLNTVDVIVFLLFFFFLKECEKDFLR